jgi:hypothetical protein
MDPKDCPHGNTFQSRNIDRTLVCIDCGTRDPFGSNPQYPVRP